MRADNMITLTGHVGQDPELKVGRSGMPWCSLSLATNRRRRTLEGEWEDQTDWHDVRLFGQAAHFAQRELRKGSRVEVEGSLAYDTWTDDDGNRRRSARILATAIRLADVVRPVTQEGAASMPLSG